jgi:hypothetical protein
MRRHSDPRQLIAVCASAIKPSGFTTIPSLRVCNALDRMLNPIKHVNDPHYPEDWTFGEILAEFERTNQNAT